MLTLSPGACARHSGSCEHSASLPTVIELGRSTWLHLWQAKQNGVGKVLSILICSWTMQRYRGWSDNSADRDAIDSLLRRWPGLPLLQVRKNFQNTVIEKHTVSELPLIISFERFHVLLLRKVQKWLTEVWDCVFRSLILFLSPKNLFKYCNPGNFRKRSIFVLFVNSWNLWKLIAY